MRAGCTIVDSMANPFARTIVNAATGGTFIKSGITFAAPQRKRCPGEAL
jgi:hypothetical protein